MKKRFTQPLMIIVTAIGGIAIAGTATGALVIAGQAHATAGPHVQCYLAERSRTERRRGARRGAMRAHPGRFHRAGPRRAGSRGSPGSRQRRTRPGERFRGGTAGHCPCGERTEQRADQCLLLRVVTPAVQPRNPALDSCDMLLADKPTAQSVISAAISSVAAGDIGTSSAALRSKLQEVLISDNPLRPGTVIVTLMVPGPAYRPANAPVLASPDLLQRRSRFLRPQPGGDRGRQGRRVIDAVVVRLQRNGPGYGPLGWSWRCAACGGPLAPRYRRSSQ